MVSHSPENTASRVRKVVTSQLENFDDKNQSGHVRVTAEMIRALSNQPLAKAAKKIGISETALKRACRKLGFQKWPRRSIDVNIDYSVIKQIGVSGTSSTHLSVVPECISSSGSSSSLECSSSTEEVLNHKPVLVPSAFFKIECSTFRFEDELEITEISGTGPTLPSANKVKTHLEEECGMDLGQYFSLSASLCKNVRKLDPFTHHDE